MLDPLQFYCWVLCNGMKTRFRMVMIAHPGPGIGFHKRFMWRIIILPTPFTFFPFLDKPSELQLVSVHHLWTTFYLTGPRALLFLPPPISWPLCHFRFIHPSICQLQQLRTLSVHSSNLFFWTL